MHPKENFPNAVKWNAAIGETQQNWLKVVRIYTHDEIISDQHV